MGCHSLFRGSSWPKDQTWVSCTAGRFFTIWATGEAPWCHYSNLSQHWTIEILVCKMTNWCHSIFFMLSALLLWVCLDAPGFPGGSDGKASACNVGDLGLIPGSRRSPGEGNGNPLQDSCRENSIDGGTWWLQSMGSQNWTQLSNFTWCTIWKS